MPSNRNFGITFFVIFLIIYFLFRNKSVSLDILLISFSIIFLILGIVNSRLLTGVNFIWYKFGLLLGSIVSPIIMTLIFYIVITPIGLAMQLFSKNYLDIKKDKKKKSYWIIRKNKSTSFMDQF